MNAFPQERIAFIGAGTGISAEIGHVATLCKHNLSIAAKLAEIYVIQLPSDTGGHLGAMRRQYGIREGFADFGKVILAASAPDMPPEVLETLRFRYPDTHGSVRNYILGASILNDPTEERLLSAIKVFSWICDMPPRFKIVPVTLEPTDIVAVFHDGVVIKGQAEIAMYAGTGHIIKSVTLDPIPRMHPAVERALLAATKIVICPGTLYDILAIFKTAGFREVIQRSRATLIQVVNLMTTPSETPNWNSGMLIDCVSEYVGRPVEVAFCNDIQKTNTYFARHFTGVHNPNAPVEEGWGKVLDQYEKEGSFPVVIEDPKGSSSVQILEGQFVELYKPEIGSKSYIRHNLNHMERLLAL